MSKLPLCSIDSIHREKNQAADPLAKKSYDYHDYSKFNVPPEWLVKNFYFSFTA